VNYRKQKFFFPPILINSYSLAEEQFNNAVNLGQTEHNSKQQKKMTGMQEYVELFSSLRLYIAMQWGGYCEGVYLSQVNFDIKTA